jgi:hypothetical protein
LLQLFFDALVSGVFFASFAWARYKPVPAIAGGLIVWLGIQIAETIASPITALPFGLTGFLHAFLRLVVLLLLVRGLVGSIRGQAMLRRLTRA